MRCLLKNLYNTLTYTLRNMNNYNIKRCSEIITNWLQLSAQYSFIPQSVLRQVHGPFQSDLSTARSNIFASNFQYSFISFRATNSYLCLLPRLSIICIRPYIFFIQYVFSNAISKQDMTFLVIFHSFHFIQNIPLLLDFCISHTISRNDLHPSPTPRLETFIRFLIYLPKCMVFTTKLQYAPNVVSFIRTTSSFHILYSL